MTTSSTTTKAITVVAVDNGTPLDLERLLQQVLKTAPRTTEIVLASLRTPRLPAPVARRIRRLPATSAEEMDAAVLAEATAPKLVLVAGAGTRLSRGWVDEVIQRALIYKDVTSATDTAAGGFLLYPPGVTSATANNVPWLQSKHLATRGQRIAGPAATSISAVLIVKDEEDVLGKCLSAVEPFVDEVVVYDTGSSDRTVEIARAHGAVVVEGYWNEHFGDARNRALEHATCDWILQVDADEVLEGDPAELRARLAVETADQLHVKIVSSSWQGVTTGLETLPVRIFRRGTSQWYGALHEYPRPMDGSHAVVSAVPAPARFIHSGYELGKVIDRQKTVRNVELAKRELEDTPRESPLRGERLSNLVRSLLWANEVEQSLPYFEEMLVTDGNPTALCMSGRAAVTLMLGIGKIETARAWVDKLEALGDSAGNVAVARARIALRAGDVADARSLVMPFRERGTGGVDPWNVTFDTAQVELLLADAKLQEGDTAGALDDYFALVPLSSDVLSLNTVLSACMTVGRPLRDLARSAPEELLARSVREAAAFHPSGALAWFEACVEEHPHDVRFVVAGNLFAARSDWQTALAWAVRAREWGLEEGCALRGLGENASMPVMERAMAWLVLAEALGEDDAVGRLRGLVAGLGDIDLQVLRGVAEMHGLATDLLVASVDLVSSETVRTS